MERDIIQIDEEKCNGCGLCISGCHEGALALVNGKAKLISEIYCDGLGACLPACPTGAITIEKRKAEPFIMPAPGSPADLEIKKEKVQPVHTGCPGSQARSMNRSAASHPIENISQADAGYDKASRKPAPSEPYSELQQWPCQLKLVPVQAPYFDQARLLIAADCAAFARAGFHEEFIKGHITVIGCPKLDSVNYAEKLTEILRRNDIKSVKIVKMEVPCCGGLEMAARTALQASGKMIPWQVVTISTDGRILED
jgi:ferredoxin